jgi:hypothetical protein
VKIQSGGECVSYTRWGSDVSYCCEKSAAEVGDSSGTQRKGVVRRWKPLPSNG